MSVIAKSEEEYKIFTKGSPEILKKLCNSNSLPLDYDEVLSEYTS